MYSWRVSAALRDDADLLRRYRELVNARAELMLYANETGLDPEFIGVLLPGAAAKKKVADRVPAQDWCLADPCSTDVCSQKSESKDGTSRGGHNKQLVAISTNGMKHLLVHVPNQELANAWRSSGPTT
jgi:hypothetical protein